MSAEAIAQRARQAGKVRAEERAEDIRLTALELHQSAPRGGRNVNAFGQARSAPGEPPAEEFGTLRQVLNGGSIIMPTGARAPVNYVVLEFGYSVGARSRLSDRKSLAGSGLQPRPLGRIALDRVKAR